MGRVSGKEMGQPWCHRGFGLRAISRCAEDVEGNGARDEQKQGGKEGAEFRHERNVIHPWESENWDEGGREENERGERVSLGRRT